MGVLLEGKEGPLDLRAQASMPWRTAESVELNGVKDRDEFTMIAAAAHVPTHLRASASVT